MRTLRMALLGAVVALGATGSSAQTVSASGTPCLAMIQGDGVVMRGADAVCRAHVVAPVPNRASVVARAPRTVAVAGTLRQRRAPSAPPAGYRSVWNDGRLNSARGATLVYVAPR